MLVVVGAAGLIFWVGVRMGRQAERSHWARVLEENERRSAERESLARARALQDWLDGAGPASPSDGTGLDGRRIRFPGGNQDDG